MLISAEHLSINFGSRQLLDDVDFYLNEGDKTGVIGINGTGKSTFLKVLAGWLQPDSGTIARKPNLQVSVLAQNPDMHDNLTVLEQIFASMPPEFRQLNEYEAKRMLTRLGLADTNRLIGTLSGGERRRAALCAALIHPADVLVLDEPTNDLDIVTLNLLEDYLRHFKGCVIVVSHDRYFVDKVVDHIWAFEGEGRIKDFPGNYSDYRLWKVAREAEEKRTMSSAGVREKRREKPEKADAETVKQRRKLTFKEKKEFEELDALIPRLEADKAALEADLSSGALSANELQEKSLALGRLMEEIDEKSMRWLELSEWL